MTCIRQTPCGAVKGTGCQWPEVEAYLGIRYATAGRWEYPVPVTAWDGEYDAARYGACSYQPRAFYDESKTSEKAFYYNEFRKGESYTYSEDCLFLNVWTPESAGAGSNLPVIVYIHGGGFTGGCGHEKHFDGPVWAAKGVVAVTFNYRLGPMGFAALPGLEVDGAAGDYGLYDQVAALQWVQRNIEAFGGDKNNVTLMGQSAGAMSVQQLCISPLTDGLFSKAVMSSGGGAGAMIPAVTTRQLYPVWEAVMKAAGCSDAEEFRQVSPEALFAAWNAVKKASPQAAMACFPGIDGKLIPCSVAEALKNGTQKAIPYMMGSNQEDVLPLMMHDMAFSWCKSQAAAGRPTCYAWHFNRHLPGSPDGSWHSADLWYWFGTLDHCWRPMEAHDRVLSEQMSSYLVQFAATGDPNRSDLPHWDAVTTATQNELMVFGDNDTQMGEPDMDKVRWNQANLRPVGE